MKKLFSSLVTVTLLCGAPSYARSDAMYWSEFFGGGDIRRAGLDGTGQSTVVKGLSQPGGINLDLAGGQMYFTDYAQGNVIRANLDGTGQTVLVKVGSPPWVALDLAGGHLYFTSFSAGGSIQRANLDGTGVTTLVNRDLDYPCCIVLDVAGGKMYWTDSAEFSSMVGDIRRANLDGSEQETLVKGLPNPHGLTLDVANGKMYWTDTAADIRRANLDGSGQEVVIQGAGGPSSIALDVTRGQMYWTTWGTGEIRRANLDGSGEKTLITGLSGPVGIVLDISDPAPVPVTGYSVDVISDKDPQTRLAQPFHAGTFAWFEAGAVDDEGRQHNDGLPAGLSFASATASGATYQLQPANASNALQLGAGQTGTLTLTAPAVYNTLYVLASSGDGTASSVGSGSINFADGSTQAFSYNGFDWCNGQGGLHPEAVLAGPNGRADVGPGGTAFIYNQDCDFQIYETVLPVDSSHAGVAITSIDFTAAPDAFSTSIFGLSGR